MKQVSTSEKARSCLCLQVNVLAYFETLCTDTGAANVLINSSLTILIVRMLRNARAPTLRVRLASALGLLVRHATYIADELATTGAHNLPAPLLGVNCRSIDPTGMYVYRPALTAEKFHSLSVCLGICGTVCLCVCLYVIICQPACLCLSEGLTVLVACTPKPWYALSVGCRCD